MAKNLRAKIPEGDTLTIFDVNKAAVERFVKEAEPANVKVAQAPRDVVEASVREPPLLERRVLRYMMIQHFVLSMI
jgi:hypothetical protein